MEAYIPAQYARSGEASAYRGGGDRHATPAVFAVFRPDGAAVGLYEAPRDREAEAGAAARARPRFVGAPEAVEHPIRGSRCDSVAGVLDRDDHVIGVRFDDDRDLAPRR